MPNTRISARDKECIIASYERYEDYQEVARTLGIKPGTAYAIVRRFRDTGVVARRRGGPHNIKVDEEMTQAVVQIVQEHVEYTLSQVNEELRLRLPNKPRICDNSIANMLNGQLITLKLTRDVPTQRNSHPVKEARQAHATWLLQNAVTERVYLDESGFHLWTKRSYGRSMRGQRAPRIVNARQSRHMSVIFAVSNQNGLLRHSFKEGGYRHEDFNAFLRDCSSAFQNRSVVFVFDNAPSHARVADVQLQPGHATMYQPAYSPFLNLCESAFSVWKSSFKRSMAEVRDQVLNQSHQQRIATLMQVAEQTIAAVTAEKVRNMDHHLIQILPRCLHFQDIDIA